ncbi:autotransporter outer membrane beta-barrel domain-containing protein [Escherichia coli]|nr:autotransporter outer membrane beta-barrel domain-containing protein [Escherichia coli]ELC3369922.1 autotransporter outer membrane beta-barrel domain-containing protein [Escherichia coli]
MTFNATLGGDNSPTDKMNVKGDTQGNTRVRVDNIGGVGAQTVNGIELIEVGGNSAGNFALTTGTVEAGAYVYTLAKGKGNDEKNWYLTSKWDGVTPADTPDPINNPPVVDPEGPSVYRPEAGSYISNIAAANSLFSHRLHDRLGEPQYTDSLHSQGSASSMWMRHVGGHERSRAGDGQLNTQANRYVLQLGGDLAQWSSNAQDRWHLGVMAGYANQHSNTQSNRVGYKSDGRKPHVEMACGLILPTSNGASTPYLNPPFYPRSRISQRLSRRADKMCFQIDLSSLKDKTYNIPLSG